MTSPCCPGGASGGFHSYSPEVPPAVMPGGPWAAPPDCSGSVSAARANPGGVGGTPSLQVSPSPSPVCCSGPAQPCRGRGWGGCAVMGSQKSGPAPRTAGDTGAGEWRLSSPSHLGWFRASSRASSLSVSPVEREEAVAKGWLPAARWRSLAQGAPWEGCWSSTCQGQLGDTVGTWTTASGPLPSGGRGLPDVLPHRPRCGFGEGTPARQACASGWDKPVVRAA